MSNPNGRPRRPEWVRFVERIEFDPSGCWLWTGARNENGYAYFGWFRDDGRRVMGRAHRYAYERLVGPIPDGLTLDHTCRVRHCLNPAHLEPVSFAENQRRRRSATCKRGHDLTAPGATYGKGGKRGGCKRCNIASATAYNQAHKEERRLRRKAGA